MDTLTSKQIRYLRSQSHHLSPVVQEGKDGMSEAFLKEVDRALKDHELIKVRLGSDIDDREERQGQAELLASQVQAVLVQKIGFIVTLYRGGEKNKYRLPA